MQWCINPVESSLHLQMVSLHIEYDAPVRESCKKRIPLVGCVRSHFELSLSSSASAFLLIMALISISSNLRPQLSLFTMPIPVLPQEILDLLVDTHKLYSPEDRTSLWRLAQASRCFLDRCYSSIFEEVYFGVPSETGKEARIFAEFPHLCKFIRAFRAECNMRDLTSEKDDEIQRSMLHIARLSTGIERIQLVPIERAIWYIMGLPCREAIDILFQQRLSSVSICRILGFPLQKLWKLSSLKHLVVDWGFSFPEERNPRGLWAVRPFSQGVEDSQVRPQTLLQYSHSLQIHPGLVDLSISISSMREHVFRWDNVISAKNLRVTLKSLQLNYYCHARQRSADDYNLGR